MNPFRKFEKFLITLGILIFCLSLYFFLFQSDRLSVWLGAPIPGSMQPVGKIEAKKNMTRRRLKNGSEFLPVDQEQNIFSLDTLMTGKDSEMRLVLNDGSKIALGPDSLIEIKFKDTDGGFGQSEFVVNVKQGEIQSSVKSGQITVIQNNGLEQIFTPSSTPSAQVKALPPSTPTPAPTPLPALATPTPTPVPTPTPKPISHCETEHLKVSSLTQNPKFFPALSFQVQCLEDVDGLSVQIQNSKKEVISTRALKARAKEIESVRFDIKQPGSYQVVFNDPNVKSEAFTVARDEEGMSFEDAAISCDRTISFKGPGSMGFMKGNLFLVDLKNRRKIREKTWDGKFSLPIKYAEVLPEQVQLVLDLHNSFRLISKSLLISAWKDCIQAHVPSNRSQVKTNTGTKKTLFTWSLSPNETYSFRLSRDPDLKILILREETKLNFVKIPITEEGTYYWQVNSSRGEYSEINEFKAVH